MGRLIVVLYSESADGSVYRAFDQREKVSSSVLDSG